MKKALPVILIILVLVIVGWLILSKGRKEETSLQIDQQALPQATVTPTPQSQSFSGKLKDVLGLATPMRCEWKIDDQHFGTTWIGEKKMYNEVSQAGKLAYTILKDNCLWSWGEEADQGVKICFEPKEGEEIPGFNEPGESAPPADVDYNCRPEILIESKFNPPTSINFMDLSQIKGLSR